VADGIPRVKMKVGRKSDEDPKRVAAAREAINDGAALFVDANGAYSRTEALALARRFAEQRVTWFEASRPGICLELKRADAERYMV